MFSFRSTLLTLAIVSGLVTSFTIFAETTNDGNYDRLDGTGESGKRVDVIEWEGNLEIHTYPKGSVAGLGAKLDDRDPGKKVMVIGYRFNGVNQKLVRRAILGIPFTSQIKGFKDPTAKDYDKIAFSNQNLGKPWVPYKLDPAPLQWYPDGDERNEDDPALKPKKVVPVLTQKNTEEPAMKRPEEVDATTSAPAPVKTIPNTRKPAKADPTESFDEDNQIQHFSW